MLESISFGIIWLLQDPWCILRDFNALLSTKELKGYNLPHQASTNEFGNWINSNNLLSLSYS